MVKALENYKQEMTSIYDILQIIEPDEELRPVNIFIEGQVDISTQDSHNIYLNKNNFISQNITTGSFRVSVCH